ncbi:Putative branched-chain-amino-acid aminotransferase TOXF [Cytospora mali]|uniref:Branched-chain-amino-acid aminotransferase TOXF n=1 Tax=Cytospora mali TaxID=578113 RepID=A0A194W4U9_CYTMA|nr:Putative branched-chain-amino-acid aminotransferase TOXF [Valsa mali]
MVSLESSMAPAAFPPEPANIDWSTVSLVNLPTTNGHVQVHFSTSRQAWGQPQLIKDPYIRVHGLAPGLNYGQQCYEGMKAFRTAGSKETAIHLFRPHAHAARIRHSASLVMLPEIPEALFLECVRMAVAHNAEFVPPATVADGAGFMYLRPVLFGAGPQLALQPPEDIVFAVYVAPVCTPYHGTGAVDAVVLDDFDRAAPRGTGSGKVGGNYAPVWPHSARAYKQGYGLVLHLDSETRSLVEEFSTSGFIGLVTAGGIRELYQPDTDNAIRSVTSESLATLAEQEGWTVRREKIPFSELGRFSQVYAVGTGATAVPVRSVTRPSTGEKYEFAAEGAGLELVKKLLATQRGLHHVDPSWCWEVREKSEYTNGHSH